MRVFPSIVVAILSLLPRILAASDLFLGSWQLDVERSRYAVAGTCPKRMTIEMSAADRGVRYHSEAVLAHGSVVRADYTAPYDGLPVMVLGSRGIFLPVSLKRMGPNTVVATYTNAFEVVATSKRVVSEKAKVMTITTVSRDGSGKAVTNVGVYRRIRVLPSGGFDLAQAYTDLSEPK